MRKNSVISDLFLLPDWQNGEPVFSSASAWAISSGRITGNLKRGALFCILALNGLSPLEEDKVMISLKREFSLTQRQSDILLIEVVRPYIRQQLAYWTWEDEVNRRKVKDNSPPKAKAITARQRIAILGAPGVVCAYCSKPHEKMQIDHVIPQSKGGTSDMTNLVACCPSCNAAKGDRTPAEWRA